MKLILPIGMMEIERAVAAFARTPNGGLIAARSSPVRFHGDLIVALAARHKLPAVYYERIFVDAGGLISYGSNYIDLFRQAAGYVDRILKGEKPQTYQCKLRLSTNSLST